jgi:hypothetical protein
MLPHPSRLVLGLMALGLAYAAPARAQGAPSHVDVWASAGASSPGTGRVTTLYVPELKYFTIEGGSAGQAVTIDSDARFATELGLDVFFTEAFGVEAWFARDTLEPTGTSSTYDTSLRYVSRPPPSYDPVIVDYARSDEWVPVSTEVRRSTTAINAVVRWGARKRVGGTISGGFALVKTSGEFTPLGYTMFVLGGHSTLFPNEYKLTTEMEPTTERRANLGGTLDVHLARHVSLSFALRQVLGSETTSTLRVTAVDRSSAGFEPPSNEDITTQLASSSVTLPTKSTRAAVGIKVGF